MSTSGTVSRNITQQLRYLIPQNPPHFDSHWWHRSWIGCSRVSFWIYGMSVFLFPMAGCLNILKYSEWIPEMHGPMILHFQMLLTSIPPWMSIYSNANTGCVHRIAATMKVRASQSHYEDFTRNLRSTLSAMQCRYLEKVFSYYFKYMLD
jgi:hypothetical protein